mmetsp:Transcript_53309/g.100273  ORF Transcript_53309/g.100273 Transcript_53309/m.100273 type:complete len:320 (+) Transcript_53309:70-1029(+)
MSLRCFALVSLLTPVSAAVPVVRLRNGVEMPLIAAGTWKYNVTEAEASVSAALNVGFTMVDTAYDYYNQAGVGRAIHKHNASRSSLFVETKVPGCGFDGVTTDDCYNHTKTVLETDLSLLKMDYVDLVIIHFPPKASFFMRSCHLWVCTQVQDQWRALEEFYAAGKAKAIGVSNFCPSCFACLDDKAKVFPMVNQVAYHIGMGADPSGFRSYAEKRGLVIQAYSPLGGMASLTKEILSGEFTTSLAKAHGKSTATIALKYLVQRGVPTITKSSNPVHLADDLDLWSWNLTDAEMAAADKYHVFGMPSFACNFEDSTTIV